MREPAQKLYIIPLCLQGRQIRLLLSGPADEDSRQHLLSTVSRYLNDARPDEYLPELRDRICQDLHPLGFQRVAH